MKYRHAWAFPDADEFMADELRADGTYQGSHLDAAMTYVTQRRLAVDGGAHVGTWSRRLSRLFDKVIAVEPSQDTHEALLENMKAFTCDNVDVRKVALGAVAGTVSMAMPPRGEQLKNTGARHVAPGADVPLETIDSWGLDALDFLKLDVEGSELVALLGARKTLRLFKPVILFEDKRLWERFGSPRRAPQMFLENLCYKQLQRVGCDEIWGPA